MFTSWDNLATSFMSSPLACSTVQPGGTYDGGVHGLAVADDKVLLSFCSVVYSGEKACFRTAFFRVARS